MQNINLLKNNFKLNEKCAHFKNRIFKLINKKSILQADLEISDRCNLKLHERCAALRKDIIQLGNNETNLNADLAFCLEEYAVLRKGMTNKREREEGKNEEKRKEKGRGKR